MLTSLVLNTLYFGSKFIWINDGQKRMRFNGKENEIPNGFIKGYKL